jgi:hypothetical protein
VTLGAPFWFDLLNKFMSLRTALKPTPDDEKKGAAAKTPGSSGPPPPPPPPPPAPAADFVPHEWAGADPQEGVL